MESQFDIEIWADTKKMKRILLYLVLITAVAWIAHIIGNIFWDEYSYEVYSIKYGTNVRRGWPVTLYWWGIYIGIIAPVSFTMIYFIMNKKEPSLALNSKGLFVNEQLIRQTLVPWSNISRIEKSKEGSTTILEFYFKDVKQIIDAQSSAKRAFLNENFKDGNPLKCNSRLTVGDFDAFTEKAKKYIAA